MNRRLHYESTKKAYNETATEYFEKVKDFPPSTTLLEFITTLKAGYHVIDLGCGPARDAKYFIDAGIQYSGVDFSEEAIEIARKNNPKATFQVSDLRSVNFPKNSTNAFIALASLYHLNRNDFKKLLVNVYSALKSGGQFYLVMKKGKGEEFGRDTRYENITSKFASYYSKKELIDFLKNAGFYIKKAYVVSVSDVNKRTGANYQSHPPIFLWAIKK